MDTHSTPISIPGMPRQDGPHELAWSYILDHIYADAFHSGITSLRAYIPTTEICGQLELRSRLSGSRQHVGGESSAVIRVDSFGPEPPRDAVRMYTIRFGVLAPRILRPITQPAKTGWKLDRTLSAFTWKAHMFSIPIRLAGFLRRPDLIDRAQTAMRKFFITEKIVPAFYHLEIWNRQ